ncbi:peptidoglycan-binding protein [Streptomyces sp. NPDC001663]|uniref:peptidoglycan-binding protein n=1 Tax=Streptomyces sp. NPDC001663 TaxID=3364597 RepID=UPI0036738E7E
MATPVFEEFDPAGDCDCPGCAHWRRVLPYARSGRHPAAHRTVIVAAAASAALGAGHVAPALAAPYAPPGPGVPAGDEVENPQGPRAPLYGPAGKPAKPKGAVKAPLTTRAEIIDRAKKWVAAQVPYDMAAYWSDGYRQDCSGYVSMAWSLPQNEWTGSLDQFAERISKEELQPGDILLFHNPANPQKGSHVVIFGGWTDYTHTYYTAYEQTPPHARRQPTPYGYWSHSESYLPYRYKGLSADASGPKPNPPATAPTPYPGAVYFGPGANNKYVTRLGEMLVKRGGKRFYTSGPGPRWSDADRKATQAFQTAQGWKGAAADGLPGPKTWELLVSGKGKDIPATGVAGEGVPDPATGVPGQGVPDPATGVPGEGVPDPATGVPDQGVPDPATGVAGRAVPASHGVQGYPGRALFRPGADNGYVTQLGAQLVKKGFGKYYTTGPGPRWGEADRRNVEAFQRAQGWRGGAADGYPGPETWRRLFS